MRAASGAVGLLLAGLAGEASAETIREVQIGDTVVAYDADRFRMTPLGADSLEVNCKSEDCSPGIGMSAARSACGAPSSAMLPDDGVRRTSATSLISDGRVFQLVRRDNGCRNLVPPALYACVEIGANAITFNQTVIGCRRGPIARPNMTEFLTAIRLRPASPAAAPGTTQ
ncbi:MAG: hypothetical protein QOJ15_4250 [Bradyrhizobium sp.]|jgi:hypothetical protein|nr:hypothetical protein [Bradyrhizobium sp.]